MVIIPEMVYGRYNSETGSRSSTSSNGISEETLIRVANLSKKQEERNQERNHDSPTNENSSSASNDQKENES